jgi:DNA polymerase III subunit beta
MKIECLKEKLSVALLYAERITGKNLTLPVLSCILIEAKDNSLTIRSTNLDLGIEIHIPVKVEKEGSVAVPGQTISQFINNLQGDKNIKLEVVDGNLAISSAMGSTTIKSMSSEDFPTIPVVPEEKSFEIESEDFVRGLKSVWYSSSVSGIKPELSSILIASEEDGLVFAATDSFRLAEKRIKTKKQNDFGQILIPFKNIPEIIRVLEGMKDITTVHLSKNQISFSADGIYLVSRVIDGVFPDYKQIIPKESKTEAIVLKQDLLHGLKLATIFSDKFNQISVSVRPEQKVFELKTRSSEVGENVSRLIATISGEDVDINFNYKYIVDCFQSIDVDTICLQFNGVNRPVVIKGVSDKSFMYLVMPMNR